MNKSELIAAVAEATGISKSDASSAVDATFDVISDALTNGDDVRLTGFGSFTIVECAAREGRIPVPANPQDRRLQAAQVQG